MSHNGTPPVSVPKAARRYLDWLVTAKCGSDLLSRGLFPNAKEVTESCACFEAVRHLGLDFGDSNVKVVVIGDGHVPRTGAMFAMRSRWTVLSIDPVMRSKDWKVDRLYTYSKKAEQVCFVPSSGPLVIVMPHSHAPLAPVLERYVASGMWVRHLITLDCCVMNVVSGRAPDVEYRDEGCWSPHNLIRIWKDV